MLCKGSLPYHSGLPMNCLFFDIASHCATFAVVSENHVLILKEVDAVVRDDELPILVEGVLQEAALSMQDLTHVACVVGPGGFTSLRVAVTYANVLSDQLDIPLAGLTLADLFSARCSDSSAVWIHSTKRQEVFVRGVSEESDHWSWPAPVHLSLDAALEGMASSVWCGELIESHRQAVVEKGMREAVLEPLTEALPPFLTSLAYAKAPVVPWYGRNW